jgi:predicted dehydrogenase
MTARFGSGALATVVATRFATGYRNDLSLTLHGDKGALRVETDGAKSSLKGCFGKDIDKFRWRGIATDPTPRNAARFIEALRSGVNGDPSFRRAADMQKLIDAAFESDGSGKRAEIR